jgi:cellulose synthase (UDP-forming)
LIEKVEARMVEADGATERCNQLRAGVDALGGGCDGTQSDTAGLPSAPTDAERDSYFARHLGVLTTLSILTFGGIVLSAGRFALGTGLVAYFAAVGLYALYTLISLRVNGFTRSDSLAEHRARVEGWTPDAIPSIDVFLPVCGEPLSILRNTWAYVANLSWPGDLTVYVMDDKNDPAARAMAEGFGFTYMTRPNAGWFKKAGNLHYAYERSAGDFVAIFDADFCPRRDYLYELMPYFDDAAIGIVQSPQHFRVAPEQGWLERGAGAVQEFFYRVVQTSRQRHGGAICVGTCAIYRRVALDANGGTTLIEHSEDVHTGFDLRARGWGLRYVPTVAATGVCPDDVGAFFRQQYRWCMGSMSLLRSRKFWATRMRLTTRLCYASGFLYYAHTALATLSGPIAPVVLLIAYPEKIAAVNYLILLPAIANAFIFFPMWNRCRFGVEAWTVKLVYGWAHLFAIIDIIRGRPMGWAPTGAKVRREYRVRLFWVLAAVWSGGAALAWTGLAGWHMVTSARPWDFAPMLSLGLFQFVVVGLLFTSTSPRRSRAAVRRPLLRPAAQAVALALALALVAGPASAEGRVVLGISGTTARYEQLEKQRMPLRIRATFQSWGSGTRTPARELAQARALGATPMLTWEPWDGQDRTRPFLRAIVDGRFDDYVRRSARDVRAFHGRVYVRFGHEMNGVWYPWSAEGPRTFVAAWQHVWRLFRQEGARNAVWVWSPDGMGGWPAAKFWKRTTPWWPGSRFVDRLGTTLVHFATQSPDEHVAMARIDEIHARYRKPLLLTEVKVDRAHARPWMSDLEGDVAARPWITGLVWSETASGRQAQDPEAAGLMDWSLAGDAVARGLLRRLAR